MSINPRDYDLEELRKMARERGDRSSPREMDDRVEESDIGRERESVGRQSGVDKAVGDVGSETSAMRAGLYRELLPLEASGESQKPYLHRLPESYSGEHLIFEWMEFLLLHAGYQGAMEALDYYESVDWITADCQSSLNDYMLGFEETVKGEPQKLDVDDHLLSLVYIAKLSSMC